MSSAGLDGPYDAEQQTDNAEPRQDFWVSGVGRGLLEEANVRGCGRLPFERKLLFDLAAGIDDAGFTGSGAPQQIAPVLNRAQLGEHAVLRSRVRRCKSRCVDERDQDVGRSLAKGSCRLRQHVFVAKHHA